MRDWSEKARLYRKCVSECTDIIKKYDYFYDWTPSEDECLRKVNEISNGTVYYWKPFTEALRNLGVDI